MFINPPYERIARGYGFVRHITNQASSLGLLHLAAEVREHGYQPSIIESDIFNLTIDQIVERVVEENPAYVGITLFTVGVWSAASIAQKIKQELPNTIIIVGGPHVSSMGKETISRFEEFDYAVNGEGEKPLVELLMALEAGTNLMQVSSIIFKKHSFVHVTPGKVTDRVLDELPMPAWDLLPDFPRAYMPAIYDYPRGPVATIAASRGCPFHCKFCDTSTFGDRVRHYSPIKVFEMMQHLHGTYGVRHIMFVDDLFLASKVRVTELCNMILDAGLKMTWSCTARVDTVKPGVLELIEKSWLLGNIIWSGDRLKSIVEKKWIKLRKWKNQSRRLTGRLRRAFVPRGCSCLVFLVRIGRLSRRPRYFIRRIPMTIMNLSKFTPYPGSPIYRDLYGTNIREDHWEKMNGMNFIWSPEGLSVEELDRQYQEILMVFYRRPQIGLYYTKLTLMYPNHFIRLLRFGLGYLNAKARSFLSGRKGLLVKSCDTTLD